ncbi:MAG TPA: hypothetical protein PKO06_23685 [Candidatus Ozemobacteraceae bacterium]|nr:hypothetical protein [Candidatus Ozemobacteraceae bacterium]
MKLSVSFLLLIAVLFSTGLYAQPVPLETTPNPQVREIQTVVNEIFPLLIKKDSEGFLKKLFEVFPIGEQARISFSNDVKHLIARLQSPLDFEFVGYRMSGQSVRFIQVYYLTIHPTMPLGWEFTFYRPVADGPWQMNFLRYHSDELYEFLNYPKLAFEVMQKTLREELQGPRPTISDVTDFNRIPNRPLPSEVASSPTPAPAGSESPAAPK